MIEIRDEFIKEFGYGSWNEMLISFLERDYKFSTEALDYAVKAMNEYIEGVTYQSINETLQLKYGELLYELENCYDVFEKVKITKKLNAIEIFLELPIKSYRIF